jgi:hypothetical protein
MENLVNYATIAYWCLSLSFGSISHFPGTAQRSIAGHPVGVIRHLLPLSVADDIWTIHDLQFLRSALWM